MSSISKHLDTSETECKCGCGFNPVHAGLGVIFELVRAHEGNKPLSPSSVCRCREHNENVQKITNPNYKPYSSNSKHMEGVAMDIPSKNPQKLYAFLDRLFPDTFGIGLYNSFVHVDLRISKMRW